LIVETASAPKEIGTLRGFGRTGETNVASAPVLQNATRDSPKGTAPAIRMLFTKAIGELFSKLAPPSIWRPSQPEARVAGADRIGSLANSLDMA